MRIFLTGEFTYVLNSSLSMRTKQDIDSSLITRSHFEAMHRNPKEELLKN